MDFQNLFAQFLMQLQQRMAGGGYMQQQHGASPFAFPQQQSGAPFGQQPAYPDPGFYMPQQQATNTTAPGPHALVWDKVGVVPTSQFPQQQATNTAAPSPNRPPQFGQQQTMPFDYADLLKKQKGGLGGAVAPSLQLGSSGSSAAAQPSWGVTPVPFGGGTYAGPARR